MFVLMPGPEQKLENKAFSKLKVEDEHSMTGEMPAWKNFFARSLYKFIQRVSALNFLVLSS